MTRIRPLLALLLVASCVEVIDEREPEQKIAPGQLDTGGYDADGKAPVPCEAVEQCVKEFGEDPCRVVDCINGWCAASFAREGNPCSDGDYRTQGDQCHGGTCVGGPSVCICAEETDCAAFDDVNRCDGRLTCDGCNCVALSTPPGTPCDDDNPLTVNDVCIRESLCKGVAP